MIETVDKPNHQHLHYETTVHGEKWHQCHDGYFADPEIAHALICKVCEIIDATHPDMLIDLGGGTGFLLEQLRQSKIDPSIRLINLDCSENQLSTVSEEHIETILSSIDQFNRQDIADSNQSCLWMMRSVLHYFGQERLHEILLHIHKQIRPGEYFIHQTACFKEKTHADCLNRLYSDMQTPKWYPVIRDLKGILEATGWQVKDILDTATLKLSSTDLAYRYGLDETQVKQIKKQLHQIYGDIPGVFEINADGFTAYLHYKIFLCETI